MWKAGSEPYKNTKDFMTERRIEMAQDQELMAKEMFEDVKEKNKRAFEAALEIFKNRGGRRRGSVEFIYAALKHMTHFGVEKDLEVYKALISVLPAGPYMPENWVQTQMYWYPKQQECIIDVMVQMELNRVIPDEELGSIILNIFGSLSSPAR